MIKTNQSIYFGILTPLVFWVTVIICGLMTPNYDQLTNMVSELGAKGTETRYLFTTGLVLCAISSILFMISLYKTARRNHLNTIPVLLISVFSFSVLGAALFPLPLKLHGILGSPSMLLPLSPLLALIFWEKDKIKNIKPFSGIILLIMLMGFLTSAPDIMEKYFGLKQRFFHIGWSLWFICLSLKFTELEKDSQA